VAAADHQKPFDYRDKFSAGGDDVGGACRLRMMFRALETTKRSVNKKSTHKHARGRANGLKFKLLLILLSSSESR